MIVAFALGADARGPIRSDDGHDGRGRVGALGSTLRLGRGLSASLRGSEMK